MANEQMLKKAIEKAEKGGFNIEIFWWRLKNPRSSVHPSTRGMRFIDNNLSKIAEHSRELLFNHDFAKAFWGEKGMTVFVNVDDKPYQLNNWQHHLQQMVLEKEPLKYVERFL